MEITNKQYNYVKILLNYQLGKLKLKQMGYEKIIMSGDGDVALAFKEIELIERERNFIKTFK